MATECQLVGVMRHKAAEAAVNLHVVVHGDLAALLMPAGQRVGTWELARLARLGAVLPMASPHLMKPSQALRLLAGETVALTSRLRQCAGSRQIDLSTTDTSQNARLAAMTAQLDPAPLNQMTTRDRDAGTVLHLLVPTAAAPDCCTRLQKLISDAPVRLSPPLPPAAFAGLSLNRMSPRRIAAAEILTDISAAAPTAEIRQIAAAQLAAPVTSHSADLAAQRSAACRLMLHIADVRDRLAAADLATPAHELTLVAPQLPARRQSRRAA